jgi:hypothetical protein
MRESRCMSLLPRTTLHSDSEQWFLHWDNAPVHTAASVQNYLAVKGVLTIRHLPYLPDLTLWTSSCSQQ